VIVGSDPSGLGAEIVQAIHRDTLARWAERTLATTPPDDDRVRVASNVRETCRRIRSANDRERERVVEALGDAGVAQVAVTVSDQRRTLTVDVAPDAAAQAAEALARLGYGCTRSWTGAAAVSLRRNGESQVMTLDGAATRVIRLRWRSGQRGRLGRLFGPTPADWDTVDLPSWMWWAYVPIRPVRLLAERSGLRSRDHSELEPFLATPEDLIEPLLDIAGVGPDDVLLDFGCGDGRFVVAAARDRRCRAIGVEQQPEACRAARARAERSGVSDRVRVVNADASSIELSEVSVVVLFLPMVVAARTVPDLLDRLRPGARIVLHEQSPLAPTIPPADEVVAVVVDDAVTVAHRWTVGDGR
jgi:SAM-dependent methyltransferase